MQFLLFESLHIFDELTFILQNSHLSFFLFNRMFSVTERYLVFYIFSAFGIHKALLKRIRDKVRKPRLEFDLF